MKLNERKKPLVILGDMAYPYRDDFRLFLKAYEILTDENILDEDKVEAFCSIMFIDKITDLNEGVELVNAFFSSLSKGKGGEALFSLNQDSELIFAGFYQTYGLNLFTAELTIEEFFALLKGLPKGTRFSEVVEIRSMPVPKLTKYNQEQVLAIQRAKASVRLKNERTADGWNEFGNLVKSLARSKA